MPKDNRKETDEAGDNDIGSEGRKERSYYYDDAHGYENYIPDEDDENEEGDEQDKSARRLFDLETSEE